MTYQWPPTDVETPVVELRSTRLAPAQRDAWVARFEAELIAPQEAVGAYVLGSFTLDSEPDRFVWLRGFSHLGARRVALASLRGGPEEAGPAGTEVHLMRAIAPQAGLRPSRPPRDRQGALVSRYTLLVSDLRYAEWVGNYHLWLRLFLRKAGADPLASFATLPVENNYPAEPVAGGHVHAALLRSAAPLPELPRELTNLLRRRPERLVLTPTRRSRLW